MKDSKEKENRISNLKNMFDHMNDEEEKEPEKPKVFKPSPIISPVYGILDKDYKNSNYQTKNTELETKEVLITNYEVHWK